MEVFLTRALERIRKEAKGTRHQKLRDACAGALEVVEKRKKSAPPAAGAEPDAIEFFEPLRLA